MKCEYDHWFDGDLDCLSDECPVRKYCDVNVRNSPKCAGNRT